MRTFAPIVCGVSRKVGVTHAPRGYLTWWIPPIQRVQKGVCTAASGSTMRPSRLVADHWGVLAHPRRCIR